MKLAEADRRERQESWAISLGSSVILLEVTDSSESPTRPRMDAGSEVSSLLLAQSRRSEVSVSRPSGSACSVLNDTSSS
jgi:hypothetical protein